MKFCRLLCLPAIFLGLPVSAQVTEEVLVYGKAIGQGGVRANVKIDVDQIKILRPGVGVDQLLDRVTGLQVGSSDPQGGGFDSTINMRGFGKDAIGFSIDGIPNGRTTLGGGAVPNRFLETSNIAEVNVSQSAGEVGLPSRQALAGHISYVTQDPAQSEQTLIEYSSGSFDYDRYFLRHDTGDIADGMTAYFSIAQQNWDVWVGEGTSNNQRLHIDVKLAKTFENGAVVKFRNSYNDRNTVGYNIVSYLQTPCADAPNLCFFDPFAPANPAFTLSPEIDGYTDDWTGNPLVDRLYRPTRGNDRKDNLSYFDNVIPVNDQIIFSNKLYYHSQDGIGRFMNHVLEGAVPEPVQDAAQAISGDVTAIDAADPQLFFRQNTFNLNRYGLIFELNGETTELFNWKLGVWFESQTRTQKRNWYRLLDEASGPVFDPEIFHVSENKQWDNDVTMAYLSNSSELMDGKLRFDYGFSFIDNDVDYKAPIQDSDEGLFNYVNRASANSGILPKLGVLFSVNDNIEWFAGYAENAATVSDGVLEEGAAASLLVASQVDEMDRSDIFDIGLRYTGDTFAAGIQAFSIESQEILVADAANTLSSLNLDQGKKINGVELTLQKNIGKFDIYFSFTDQNHEYVFDSFDTDSNGYPAVGFVKNGEPLVGIPDQNVYMELKYKSSNHFFIGLSAQYVSSRAGFYGNPNVSSGLDSIGNFITGDAAVSSDESIPSYTLWAVSSNYKHQNMTFSFNIENLFDENYLSGVAPELLGVDRKFAGRYFIGAPRTAVLSLQIKF